MRTANEIEAGILDQLHVAMKAAVGHRIAPAGMVLMHVGTLEIVMFAVEEKPLIGGEFEPAEAKRWCNHPLDAGRNTTVFTEYRLG